MKELLEDKAGLTKFGDELSRDQMRNVLGGVEAPGEPGPGGGHPSCSTGQCSWTDAEMNTSYGACKIAFGPDMHDLTWECYCNTPKHPDPSPVGSNNGVSRCQISAG